MTKNDKQILLGRLSAASLTVRNMGTKIHEFKKTQMDLAGDIASLRRQLESVNTYEEMPPPLEEPDVPDSEEAQETPQEKRERQLAEYDPIADYEAQKRSDEEAQGGT